MFCTDCGKKLHDHAKFCAYCGCPVKAAPSSAPAPVKPSRRQNEKKRVYKDFDAGKQVTPNIILGADGKYRWIYEMSLFKNPTIFLLVWKIFFFILLGIFAFMMILTLFEGNMDGVRLLEFLKFFGIAVFTMTALVGISCLIYAAIMGGKYIVLFEMDENGINHKQVPTQAKKAQGIAAAAVMIGMLAGSRAAVTGGMAASNTEMYTDFSKTRKVRFFPRRDLIKIRQLLFCNQVYAKKEDFSFVQSYILQRVPDKAKPKSLRQNK